MSRELPGYDNWKTTDETDPDNQPRPRRPPVQLEPREFESKVVNGRRIYEEDYLYDPLGRD